METYKVKMICRNCFHQEEVEIPKGKTKAQYRQELRNKLCPNCGCER